MVKNMKNMKRTFWLFLFLLLFFSSFSLGLAGTKTLLIDGLTGAIATDTVGNTSFEITAASDYKCVRVDGFEDGDVLFLMGEKYTDSTWAYVYYEGFHVQLDKKNPSVCPAEIRTYILQGKVTGTISAYTEEP